MSVVASWGPKSFGTFGRVIYNIDNMALGHSAAASESNDDSGKPATNKKGSELRTADLTIKLSSAVGNDVQGEISSWDSLLEAGKAYALIIGGVAQSKNPYRLQSINASDVKLNDRGMYIARVVLKFKEYIEEPAKAKGKRKEVPIETQEDLKRTTPQNLSYLLYSLGEVSTTHKSASGATHGGAGRSFGETTDSALFGGGGRPYDVKASEAAKSLAESLKLEEARLRQ